MSHILAPLNAFDDINALIQAGADEFYMGFHDPFWSAVFGPYADLNRMSGFKNQANSMDFDTLLDALQTVAAAGKAAYVTFNTAAYDAPALALAEAYFPRLAAAGAQGVIVSGPEFIDLAHEARLSAVASTMCAIFNTQIAQFYCDCGIDRIILPRDLSLEEIAAIIRATPHVSHEVFCMRNGCIFSDSHCLGQHEWGNGALCGNLRQANMHIHTSLDTSLAYDNADRYYHQLFKCACGLCALWDFETLGVDAYKVVGRCDEPQALCRDIALVREELEIAQACSCRSEYLRHMRPHPYADKVCNNALNCYYPEIFYE